MSDLAVIILAAGKGERMQSDLPKVLHPLGDRPLFSYSLEAAKSLRPKKIVAVIGHGAEQVKKKFAGEPVTWVLQREQLGTAHAVLCGLKALGSFRGPLLILYGDVPLVREGTLRKMLNTFLQTQSTFSLLTTELADPTGYGRVIRDGSDHILRIVEEKEAEDWEKEIHEVNSGICLVRAEELRVPLQKVKKSLMKGEYYLTDLAEEFSRRDRLVTATLVPREEVLGINSREELAQAEEMLQKRIRREWMEKGVTLIGPESIRIGSEVKLSKDVILHPGVILTGRTQVGRGTEIFAYSVIEDSKIGAGARIGPFAHLRPESFIGDGAHVGNFVETKKTTLGKGAKANHLAYLGDATIGAKANIGAGTITCNYDGHAKHRTVIGEGAFIGSDTQLVAPVRVGKNAFVGAGTTVTKNVPTGALAISRTDQKNIRDWRKKGKK